MRPILRVLKGRSGDPGGNLYCFFIAGGCVLPEGSISVSTVHVGGQNAPVNQVIMRFAAAKDISVNPGALRKNQEILGK